MGPSRAAAWRGRRMSNRRPASAVAAGIGPERSQAVPSLQPTQSRKQTCCDTLGRSVIAPPSSPNMTRVQIPMNDTLINRGPQILGGTPVFTGTRVPTPHPHRISRSRRSASRISLRLSDSQPRAGRRGPEARQHHPQKLSRSSCWLTNHFLAAPARRDDQRDLLPGMPAPKQTSRDFLASGGPTSGASSNHRCTDIQVGPVSGGWSSNTYAGQGPHAADAPPFGTS